MQNAQYWKQRFTQLENAQNQMGAAALKDIEQQYKAAQNELEAQMYKWYSRIAANNGVSMAEAHKLLSGNALKEFKWDVDEYIRYGRENAVSGAWIKELENASAKFHISGLEAMKIQTQQSLEALFAKYNNTVSGALGDIYKSSYYHTAYELQKGFNIGWDITGIDQGQLEKVLVKPWAVDGYNFSERIWANKSKLINEVHTEISRNIMLGQDPQKAIDAIAKKMNTSKNNAGRLVMTEEAYFSSAAQRACFDDLGVEQYEIVATLDSHTSDICQSLDGKVFSMKEYEAGVTAPPFHVNCRSTTAPHFDENFSLATDGEKTYRIPDDMSYDDWLESLVKGGDKDNLQLMASEGNNWNGANPISHTSEELEELNRYAEDRGIKLYQRQPFDGDISVMKSEIDTIERIRKDFNHNDYIQLGWKTMSDDDFGETSANHQQIWINRLALRNRSVTEANLAADNWLAANTLEGIAAHEMGHVISGKLKKGVTGIDIYKQTVYNVSGKMVSDEEAKILLANNLSEYSAFETVKNKGLIVYDEIISEILSVHYTTPNKYSTEFVELLKKFMKGSV